MPKSEQAISIQQVTFTYPGSEQPVLNEATLELARGSFTAIIGGNGCGKSTMCKLFNGLIPQFYTGDFSGEVHVLGTSAAGQAVAELSKNIGYVYQDFDNQLVRPTVLDEACFAPLNYGLPHYRELGERALAMCGLTGLNERYIWELSGGQKHLLALAGALSMDPDILIVDEPVSQLDPQHARQIYECLSRLHRDHGKTIIVIEHHTEFIADFCEDVVLMEQGRVVWKLSVREGLNQIDDLQRLGIQPPEVTRAAIAVAEYWAINTLKQTTFTSKVEIYTPNTEAALQTERTSSEKLAAEALLKTPVQKGELYPVTVEEAAMYFSTQYPSTSSGTDYHHTEAINIGADDATASPLMSRSLQTPTGLRASRQISSLEPMPVDMPTVTQAYSHATAATPVVEFSHTRLSYRGLSKQEHEVIRGLNLTMYEGERIALVGNNGAGKSSLLKLIAGISLPQSGSVSVLGQLTNRSSLERLAGQVAYIFQQPGEMFIEDSVHKEVSHFMRARRMPDAEQHSQHVLERFRLGPLQDRDARLLSGGQQRRVTLAIGAAMRPALMLLDEPTANLDMATREELIATLAELDQHVRTTVIATHDMQLVTEWATRVIVLHHGQVEADGPPADIFADVALLRRCGLALTQIMELSHRMELPSLCSTTEDFVTTLLSRTLTKEDALHAACPQLA
ncbi:MULTISPECIES: ABC transporter ATP-binding protein [Paenibacillus]|uniref:ABC transporter ATP-binding protein n=1 Tax=Paenibacillus TaxID=44249 RepID=UPI00046F13E1|nr:ABC transporter ATP-binding protein [Paenibacillus massiliensis]